MTGTIAPGLLLAMPHVPDPTFAQSVILVAEHSDRGTFGLIVNRPTEVLLSEILQETCFSWPEPTDQVIWDGGPVRPSTDEPDGFILHLPERFKAGPRLHPEGDAGDFLLYPFPPGMDLLESLASEDPARLRFLMGYAAWAPGQLELELRDDAWLLAPADPLIVFGTPPEQMWEAAFHSLGVEPSAILPSSGLH